LTPDNGVPRVPYSDTAIKRDYLLRVFGPEKLLRKYFEGNF
jgi:hypothetical protein